jgi:anaerobic dimethyl sulfoxide reductase subunit B (iron-sulfur subunit)
MNRAPIFVVDMARCVGCYACSVACKDRASMPDEVDLLQVEVIEGGTYPQPTLAFRVTHCFHCAEPPCIEACPNGAMGQRDDGFVQVDSATCIGCGQCIEACPFGAVAMGPEDIAVKCDGCADEIAQGWDPTCVRACPLRALHYGPTEDILPPYRRADEGFDGQSIGPRVRYLVRRSE